MNVRMLVFLFTLWSLNSCSPTTEKIHQPEKISTKTESSTPVSETSAFIYSNQFKFRLDTFFYNQYIAADNSFSVIIAKGDTILYEYARGYSDFATKTPVTVESAFQLASVSKPLTATAILKLIDQKKLSFTTKVDSVLKDFPYQGIEVKDLLCHRSGLTNYLHFEEKKIPEISKGPLSNNLLIDILANKKIQTDRKPNSSFSYCNTNYALLANIVEVVSGMSFSNFMNEEIFKPCGMQQSFVGSCLDSLEKMKSYSSKWVEQKEDFCDGIVGDKNIYASAKDLLLFHKALKTNKILSEAIQKEAYTPRSFEKPGIKNYGYGWRMMLKQDKTPDYIFHNGWWHGFTSKFYRNLNEDITIIILSNKFTRKVYDVNPILQIIKPQLLQIPQSEE